MGWGLVTNVAGASLALLTSVALARFVLNREFGMGVLATLIAAAADDSPAGQTIEAVAVLDQGGDAGGIDVADAGQVDRHLGRGRERVQHGTEDGLRIVRRVGKTTRHVGEQFGRGVHGGGVHGAATSGLSV